MFDRRRITLTTPNPAATVSATFPLAADYGEIVGFRALCTTDASSGLELLDGSSVTFFKDGGAVDYHVQKDIVISPDATGSGGTTAAVMVDSTGAAQTIGLGSLAPVKSPITVTWSNNGTAGDVMTLDLYYRYPLEKLTTTLTTPNPAATVTGIVNLRSKFAQIVGLFAANVTDVASTIKLTDADSRVIYMDAADKDYHAAGGIKKYIAYDDTLSNLTPIHQDLGGNAATATSGAPYPIARSPITIEWSNNATVGDIMTVSLFYRTQ